MDGMEPEDIFAGGGEMGALIRSCDWSQTPLGPTSEWPSSLTTAVSICLNARFPMVIWWGEDFRLLYNEAFQPILGDRHPQALGQPAAAIFSESWHVIGPQLFELVETKAANRMEDLLIPVFRAGYLEESYYTYSYSPLLVEKGTVGGVFTVIIETTKQILSDRRLATLTSLSTQSGDAKTIDEVYQLTAEVLARNPADIPFAALYQLNTAKTQAILCGQTPIELGTLPLPPVVNMSEADPWRFESVLHTQSAVTIEDLSDRFGGVPTGTFALPVNQARVLPVRALRRRNLSRLLIVGINPARQLDADYSAFLDLIAGRVASAIANTNSQIAEQALKVSEEKLKSFVDANVVGILFGNVSGSVHEANDEMLRIVGYSREDLHAGRLCWIDMTPSEYLPLDEQAITEAKKTGACLPYEKEYIHQDGCRVPVLIGFSLVGEAREELVAFVLDVSAHKRAQESLRQRESELSAVTNTVPVMISFVDADQRYRFNNRGYEEWFGLSAAEMYGKHLWEVMSELEYEAIRPYVERVLAGEQVAYENETFLKNNVPCYLSATYVPRLNKAGTVEGFVALISDVTDRRHIEIEREQLLQSEKAAREAAERANRIKDEFLAVVSHELRTPLSPIVGWSQLLKRGKLSPEKTSIALDTIERNAKLQVQLIGDLLDISRVLRGKMSLVKTRVDLSDVIAAALDTVQLAAETKFIEIETTISPCVVVGDAGRLQQIVWNLLSNAVKFTPEQGEVRVALSAIDNQAQIRVADTGKGISADFLPYVFEHFRQEDYSTTRQFGGLGLGLAITRQLVEMHGGRVRAKSDGENQGAAFTVTIPLSPPASDLPVMRISGAAKGDLTDVRLLIVDDETDSQEITAFVLEQAHATVVMAGSGAEALREIDQSVPHVLISDVGMPDMDGYALIRQIRQRPAEKGGEMLAIALTAYAGEGDFKQAIAAGFHRHLAKPIDPDELVATVASLLQGQPQSGHTL
ncbi:MAG: PAS domain S-box protein [Phormidesmis sp.]